MSPFSLPGASANAAETDTLIATLLLVTVLVMALVFGLMTVFLVRYRHDSGLDRGQLAQKTWRFEVGWTAAALLLFFGLFVWGADLYVRLFSPPAGAIEIAVTGKQWMWKAEHQDGQREINALHVPEGRPVKLIMTSEDVIHDFSIPAFRIKHDVLPGRYDTIWFTPTRPGTYRLFCTQFCGTEHSAMGGEVVVLSKADFADWLTANGATDTLAAQGRTLFTRYGCSGCHQAEGRLSGGTVNAPPLDGVYRHPVPLEDGSVVVADDQYIRDSILMPQKQIVAGYPARMPSFAGVIPEADLTRLIAYIKSLAAAGDQG